MNVLQTRESIEDGLELLTEGLLGILDLSGVEACAKENFDQRYCFIDNPDNLFSPSGALKCSGWVMDNKDDTSDTADLETGTDLCGKLSLSAAQDNVEEFLVRGHRRNLAVKSD